MTFSSERFAAAHTNDAVTPDTVYRVFERHRVELTNLASFLTGSDELADVCLIDAYDLCIQNGSRWKESLDRMVRRAVLESALEMQKPRLAQLRPIYSKRSCPHGQHASLSPQVLITLTSQLPQASLRLDVMCRFGLILRGSGDYTAHESAVALGVSRDVLDAAYCGALEVLSKCADELFGLSDDDEWPEVWH